MLSADCRFRGHLREILHIAVPSVISNISVPLLALVDTAIVGHMGAPEYIGAIAVGGMIFNILYWPLAFLRMGTSGFTAQAFGRGNVAAMSVQLFRPLITALFTGVLLVLLGGVIANVAFKIVSASKEVEALARIYFGVGIFGAPAVLGMYAFSGWFLGMQNARFPMWVAIAQNLVNIIASLFFVYIVKLGVFGVALGTVTAQYFGCSMCFVLWRRKYADTLPRPELRNVLDMRGITRFFSVNRDIFVRTMCIVAVMSYFTVAGASMNDTILAANTLLMQLFVVFSYFMDGFAYAGEALSGRYIGEENRIAFVAVTRILIIIGVVLAMVFAVAYMTGGKGILSILSDDRTTVAAAIPYLVLTACVPLVSFGAFVLDGICIGATASRLMLLSSVVAAAVFFGIFFTFRRTAGNTALWCAFLAYLGVRTLVEAAFYPHLVRRTFVLHQKSSA